MDAEHDKPNANDERREPDANEVPKCVHIGTFEELLNSDFPPGTKIRVLYPKKK